MLLAAPLLLLWPCVLGARTFVPFDVAQWPPVATALTPAEIADIRRGQNMDPTEIPLTFEPELRFAHQELAAGRLPEWNPYARGGAPLLATGVVGLLYPPNWLYLLGAPAEAFVFGAWLGLAIAGLLMLGFLRALGLGRPAALFGALAFAFSGTLLANAHFYQRLHALVWLPGMLWAVRRLEGRRGRARIPPLLGLAACTALSWLAGFPPYAAPATLLTALYAAALALRRARAHGAPTALPVAGTAAAALALGLGLAAVQLLPMFAFFPHSNRSVAAGPDRLAEQAFDPAGLLGYALPAPFGHPTAGFPYDYAPLATWLFSRRSWVTGDLFTPQAFNYVEYTVFPGTLVLLLAAVAALHRAHPFRRFALGALALLLVLSFAEPWLAWLHGLPGLRDVPPKRFVGPACLLVAALAAIGLEQTLDRLGKRRWLGVCASAAVLSGLCFALFARLSAQDVAAFWSGMRDDIWEAYRAQTPDLPVEVVDEYVGVHAGPARALLLENLLHGGIAFLLAGLWLAALPWMRLRRGARLALLGLAFAGTLAQLVGLGRAVDRGRVLAHPIDGPVHAFLRAQRDAHAAEGGFTVARGGKAPHLALLLPPCTLVPERIRDLNIYTFVDGRSHAPVRALFGADVLHKQWVNRLPDGPALAHPLLDLLGVRFVLSDVPLAYAGERVGPELRGPSGEFFVYERPHALPRAFWVPAVRTRDDDDAVLAALTAPDFDPRAAALVTSDQAALLPAPAQDDGAPPAGAREVRFTRDVPTDIALALGPGPAGYVVLTDTHFPGWTATCDGAAAPIARANDYMRVVAVPAGATELRFHYDTPRLALGGAVTALCVLALLALAGVYLAPRLRQRAAQHTMR